MKRHTDYFTRCMYIQVNIFEFFDGQRPPTSWSTLGVFTTSTFSLDFYIFEFL
jgi:hypothetical protein